MFKLKLNKTDKADVNELTINAKKYERITVLSIFILFGIKLFHRIIIFLKEGARLAQQFFLVVNRLQLRRHRHRLA